MFKASTDESKAFGDKMNLSNTSTVESIIAEIATEINNHISHGVKELMQHQANQL
jgi:hypothetical protein